jgi:hypothetical protein
MSWVNDLASGLGIPMGAATLAVAMYGACTAAEKAARPEALRDIGRVLNATSWSRSVRPSDIIERVFVWTFGDRQVSLRCIGATTLSTFIFSMLVSSIASVLGGNSPTYNFMIRSIQTSISIFVIMFVICGVLPDYVSLWKARLLLHRMSAVHRGAFSTPLTVLADISASIVISLIFLAIGLQAVRTLTEFLPGKFHDEGVVVGPWVVETFILAVTFVCSTLFTSLWTILISISVAVIKLLAPLQRFTAWFFNVEQRPLQAIGIVSGTLVIACAGLWSLIRTLI